ncbi:hypothetical protein BBP40_002920 [Aspergillus hancockii]|nr:hypothetical protein BBP40_002920 [Aspergillus hancockii]
MADYILSQTLSARYYQPDRFPHISETTGAEPGSGEGQILEERSTPEPPSQSANRVRKRGRPRVSPGDASPNDRRAQIRAAQRTYRLKKETMFQELKTRVSELEDSMSRISDSLSTFYQMAVQSDLNLTHPYLFQQLNCTVSQVRRGDKKTTQTPWDPNAGLNPLSSTGAPGDAFTFGYTMNMNTGANGMFYKPPGSERIRVRPSSRYAQQRSYLNSLPLERPLNGSATFTYSFNESTFARRLHRHCIEYAYQLFTDSRTDPQDIYRVFRLVTCIRQEDKMARYLASLVRAGPKEALEPSKVPFYCIGGAGTHYPHMQPDGKPMYPENMRLPGRVLGSMPGSMPGSTQGVEGKSADKRQELLKLYGLDGTWLDCRDVQGYLEEKGFCLDGSPCLFATPASADKENIGTTAPNQPEGMSMDLEYENGSKPPSRPNVEVTSENISAGQASWVLNVEEFVQALLNKMVILGRAPGFRLTDVEAAFKSAAKVSSQ